MNKKYKVGDRVRCVKGGWLSIDLGEAYYVTEIVGDDKILVRMVTRKRSLHTEYPVEVFRLDEANWRTLFLQERS